MRLVFLVFPHLFQGQTLIANYNRDIVLLSSYKYPRYIDFDAWCSQMSQMPQMSLMVTQLALSTFCSNHYYVFVFSVINSLQNFESVSLSSDWVFSATIDASNVFCQKILALHAWMRIFANFISIACVMHIPCRWHQYFLTAPHSFPYLTLLCSSLRGFIMTHDWCICGVRAGGKGIDSSLTDTSHQKMGSWVLGLFRLR